MGPVGGACQGWAVPWPRRRQSNTVLQAVGPSPGTSEPREQRHVPVSPWGPRAVGQNWGEPVRGLSPNTALDTGDTTCPILAQHWSLGGTRWGAKP